MCNDFKDYARTFCQLCAHYAHLYRLCITHIWHSASTVRHYIWCISQTCYFICAVCRQQLMLNSPIVSYRMWCHTDWYGVELEAAWSRPLHYVNSTGFPAVTARIQCKLCLLLHNSLVSHSPQYLSQLLTPVSDIPSRSALRSVRNSDFDVPRLWRKMARELFALPHCQNIACNTFVMYNKMSFINETDYAELVGLCGICPIMRKVSNYAQNYVCA